MMPPPSTSCYCSHKRERVDQQPLAHGGSCTIGRAVAIFQLIVASGLAAVGSEALDTAFLRAVGSGDIARVKSLLDAGAHIDAKGINGYFALETAIDHASSTIAMLLLERGANVNLADDFGTTA